MNHQCPMCDDFSAPTLTLLLGHVGRVHSHSPDFSFTCGINGCLTTCKSYLALKKHIYRKHKKEIPQDMQSSSQNVETDMTSTDFSEQYPGDDIQCTSADQSKVTSARWVLKIKEMRKLTQSTVNEVLGDVTELCSTNIAKLGDEVSLKLQSVGVTASDVPGLMELFSHSSPYCRPFDGLDTHYRQMEFYKKHFNLLEPVEVELGKKLGWKGYGSNRKSVQKVDSFIYIPIIQVLERMLSNSSILEQVKVPHNRSDDHLEDFCDAKKCRTHPLFSDTELLALQLFLYYDELEICNPLGSARKKHKLGFFYFTLGNVPPRFRSALKSIQLLAICKVKHVKEYGIDSVLRIITDDILKLEKGVLMETAEGQMLVTGTIVTFIGDNLGKHAVGGFKEGGSALRPCRHCMVVGTELDKHLTEKTLELRTPASYDHMCDLLTTTLDEGYDSTTFGINRRSPLNDLAYYHVCDYGLPPDIMHDVLEGYLPYTLKLMLSHFITSLKLFTMDALNTAITNTDYGYAVSSRPQCLTMDSLSLFKGCTAFPLSASETWTFARLLPVMIGHYIPEDNSNWLQFLEILDILDIVFAPVIHKNSPVELQVLIEANVFNFIVLYPLHHLIPKIHNLFHLARFIENIGPMTRHWTMWFEAKHQYFKCLAVLMGNYINVAYSLGIRHQCYQCYNLQSDTILDNVIETGPGDTIKAELTEFKDHLLLHDIESGKELYRVDWVEVNGKYLKNGGVVITKPYLEETESPEFALISEIFLIPTKKVLIGVNLFKVIDNNTHYHSWLVKHTDNKRVINFNELHSHQILHARASNFSFGVVKFITLKHAIT